MSMFLVYFPLVRAADTITAATGSPAVSPDLPASGDRRRWWRAAAWITPLISLLVNAYIAWGPRTPAFPYDEVDTLLLGRVILGQHVPHPAGAGYYPGWGLVTAPLWWLTSDPFTFYRLTLGLGVLVGLATIWPLARIATRFGVTPAQGVVAAAIVMTLPPRALQSGYSLSERLIFLLLATTVLVAFRLWERPGHLRAVLLGVLTAATLFAHARMLVVVAAVGVWLVLFALRSWRVALTGLVSAGVLSWLADRWAKHLNAQLLPHGFTQVAGLGDWLRAMRPGLLFRTLVGESWIQLIGSFGLVAVGLVTVGAVVWREVRHRQVGPAGLILLAGAALLVSSSMRWANPLHLYTRSWHRLDTWIYGRYADPAADLIVLVGLCAVIRGLPRARLLVSWLVALVVVAPTLLVVARDAPTWAFITPAHIPGAMPWWWALPTHHIPTGIWPSFTNDNRFWLIASLTALVPLAALGLGAAVRRRRAALVGALVTPLVLALGVAGTLVGNHASTTFHNEHGVPSPVVGSLRGILAAHPEATVDFDMSCPRPASQSASQRNDFMWWLLPTVVGATWEGDSDIVISCAHGAAADVIGAVRLPGTALHNDVVWIMPGRLLDALTADGTLARGGAA